MRVIKKKKLLEQGFTLIELMIAVAIVGILSSVAVSSYQSYIARAQVSEALTVGSGIQKYTVEIYQETGSWPMGSNNISEKYLGTNKWGSAVWYINGQIVLNFGSQASPLLQNQNITLYPINDGNDNIHWDCVPTFGAIKYAPASCREDATQYY